MAWPAAARLGRSVRKKSSCLRREAPKRLSAKPPGTGGASRCRTRMPTGNGFGKRCRRGGQLPLVSHESSRAPSAIECEPSGLSHRPEDVCYSALSSLRVLDSSAGQQPGSSSPLGPRDCGLTNRSSGPASPAAQRSVMRTKLEPLRRLVQRFFSARRVWVRLSCCCTVICRLMRCGIASRQRSHGDSPSCAPISEGTGRVVAPGQPPPTPLTRSGRWPSIWSKSWIP
jgi:hypothetical protein